jgi:hypothetical protein
VIASLAGAQPRADTLPSSVDQSLKQFLQTNAPKNNNNDKTTRYIAVFRDLNGDGTPEAIVYFMGRRWCGSGGCLMLILKQDGSSWEYVTKTTITRLPIRVLTHVSHGWHSISVWVQGGGIRRGYEAELRFNGKTYPTNPTVPPARRLKKKPAGEDVIKSIKDAELLYE